MFTTCRLIFLRCIKNVFYVFLVIRAIFLRPIRDILVQVGRRNFGVRQYCITNVKEPPFESDVAKVQTPAMTYYVALMLCYDAAQRTFRFH